MNTRWEIDQPAKELHPEDFIYLQDGPRAGDRLIAPGHTGKVCLAFVPNGVPKLGSELICEPTQTKTAEGMRVYRLVIPGRVAEPEMRHEQANDAPPVGAVHGLSAR